MKQATLYTFVCFAFLAVVSFAAESPQTTETSPIDEETGLEATIDNQVEAVPYLPAMEVPPPSATPTRFSRQAKAAKAEKKAVH